MQDARDPPRAVHHVVSAARIIGESVVDRQGENLGRIRDLVLDAEGGCIAYAVLSLRGIPGLSNKLLAMPWAALRFRNDDKELLLEVDKEKLEAAPAFPEFGKWPDFGDRGWGKEVHEHYGYSPYWQP